MHNGYGTVIRLVALTLLMVAAVSAQAEQVRLALRPNLTALAEYHAGAPDKPAVMILHGFLQTHQFPIVARMTDGLADLGYTVLAPTLTLGVTHRRISLACEAIHTHTMEESADEIEKWLDWLRQRHKGPIVLVGHSLGSVNLLATLHKGPPAQVKHLIGVSIMEGRINSTDGRQELQIADLRRRIKLGQREPVRESFSFCKQMNAAPGTLLSYLSWSPARIHTVSAAHRANITYIMGSRDDRLGPGWVEALRRTGVKVRMIEGANHFMDGEYEFDLLDTLVDELKTLR